jgi:nucleoside phosphorylase
MIVCAGNNENFSFATPIGVGMIQSAMNLSRLVMFDKPEFLLFIGSGGSYTKKHKIFDIVESSSSSQIELSFFDNTSYTPIDNAINSQTDFVKDMTIINSSNYINSSSNDYQNFIQNNITVENMEFFSFLSIAKEFNIPAGGIFIITNYTDTNAHNDFIQNHNKAMQKLVNYLKAKEIIK